MKRLLIACVGLLAVSCGSSSTTTPTPTPTATPTRIITVSGNLAFGNVNIGSSADRTFTVNNSGNATLTFTSLSCAGGTGTAGYTATPTTGTIAAGSTITINVHFAPTTAGFLSCVLSVVGDQTSGGAAINVSGTGVNPNPIFTVSGTGNNVFDMPTYVTRVHIVGRLLSGSSSNFIVNIAGRLVVNDLLGNSFGTLVSDGTYVTTGGTVVITNSTNVGWTFTEVR